MGRLKNEKCGYLTSFRAIFYIAEQTRHFTRLRMELCTLGMEAYTPKLAGCTLRTEVYAPKLAGYTLRMEVYAPRLAGHTPGIEIYTQRFGRLHAQDGGLHAKVAKLHAQDGVYAPKLASYTPRDGGLPARDGLYVAHRESAGASFVGAPTSVYSPRDLGRRSACLQAHRRGVL
jgi:hypothetical protein